MASVTGLELRSDGVLAVVNVTEARTFDSVAQRADRRSRKT